MSTTFASHPPTQTGSFGHARCLVCRACGAEQQLGAFYACLECFGPLEVAYDPDGLTAVTREQVEAGPQTLWRYGPLLPVGAEPADRVDMGAGMTPLVRADRLAAELGMRALWVKDDSANPTHSFKDRVVSVALTAARRFGFDRVACASTGNLANSVAAHAAAAGLDSYVFIPSNLEEQKILATGVYGTNLVAVNGNYDDVNRLCLELAGERDWAFVNVNMRPYYAEGSKTIAYEVAEQLGWELPDRVVCPVASGSLFTKIARGFDEWLEVGLVEGELPTFNGAQALGCSPVAEAWEQGRDFCKPQRPDTIAKSLAIGNPADGPYALDLAKRSGGAIDSVSDDEIRAGIKLLAHTTGVFTETAGGVTTAVLKKLADRGDIGRDERVVLVITGEGLKTLDAVRGTFEMDTIEPSTAAFDAVFDLAATAS